MNLMTTGFGIPGFKTLNANGHLIHYAEHGAGWRYDTLLEKEPETIEWIDGFQPGETLWDIGANIGIYSIYAGVKGIKTLAFEPHFANYHQFCVTIAVNGLQNVVTPLCLAFSDRKSIAELNLASLEVGTSMSNFGAALDFRGQPFQPAFRQGMLGYDIDSFVEDFGADIPDHIKIDVDGIELAIVTGAQKTLANPKVQSVSIELIETDHAQVDAVAAIMEKAGLHFVHKRQNRAFCTAQTTDVFNYLFHRDPSRLHTRETAEEQHEHPAVENWNTPDGNDREGAAMDEIAGRIAERIRAADIDPVPSANIFMEDMFPQETYAELLARLPADAALDPIKHPDAIAPDGRCTRYLLDLTQETLQRLNPDDRPFWQGMIRALASPIITDAVMAKFAPELHARFGDTMPEIVAVPVLYRDFPGYRISIHHDTPKKIATLQFYLPEDETQQHLGTSFHRRMGQAFEHHKTNRFKPNSAYAFVRTDESWHSVEEMSEGEQIRNTIALTFYIKGQEYRSGSVASTAAAPSLVYSGLYDAEMQQALRGLAQSFSAPADIASLFAADGTGVKLGVGEGDLAQQILERSNIAYLYGIAPWSGQDGQDLDQYRRVIAKLSTQRTRSTILRMHADEALDLFGEGTLDFVFLSDAASDPQGLAQWIGKIRSGGILAGDVYASQPTIPAIAAAQGLEPHYLHTRTQSSDSRPCAWFAMKP